MSPIVVDPSSPVPLSLAEEELQILKDVRRFEALKRYHGLLPEKHALMYDAGMVRAIERHLGSRIERCVLEGFAESAPFNDAGDGWANDNPVRAPRPAQQRAGGGHGRTGSSRSGARAGRSKP